MTLKWIYSIKHTAYVNIKKYKEICIAQGLSQKEGIEYEDTFAPMVRYTSIVALATVMKWKIPHVDVKKTFLNGVVEEEMCVEQPLGFETHDR